MNCPSEEFTTAAKCSLPVTYKGIKLDCGYVIDLVVEDTVVVELKAVEKI
ncbi:MAG: GxxExxY protein, partial [Terriglobales bacterium]